MAGKCTKLMIASNNVWDNVRTACEKPSIGFLRFCKMQKNQSRVIAKFDYKEKLALGCLYMKDQFSIQDRSNIS